MYTDIIKAFEDSIEGEVFESLEFNMALKKLKNSKANLKFLIGKPGTGKSFLIHHLFKNCVILKASLTKEELDRHLTKDKLIIIDEAQLLYDTLIEEIRILADTKEYSFLLSMHLKDAQEILEKEHFKSRDIDIIQLEPISKEEMIRYIDTMLLKHNITHILAKKQFDTIYKYTKGNFRYIKKFMKVLFELLQFAQTRHLSKYYDINDCLITMTAIKLGLENE